jgi:hypothetical protein
MCELLIQVHETWTCIYTLLEKLHKSSEEADMIPSRSSFLHTLGFQSKKGQRADKSGLMLVCVLDARMASFYLAA